MDRIGLRALVYWPDEHEWFGGNVSDFDENEGYYIVYDDGDERWEADATLIKFEEPSQQDNESEDDNGGAIVVHTEHDHGYDHQGDGVESKVGSLHRQMLEPPESPSAYDDDEYNSAGGYEDSDIEAQSLRLVDTDASDTVREVSDTKMNPTVEVSRPKSSMDVCTNSEGEESPRCLNPDLTPVSHAFQVLDVRDLDDIDDELEQSIETPETHCNEQPLPHIKSDGGVTSCQMPQRGRLYGKIIRGSGLPRIGGRSPSCFVRISFAEGGDSTRASSLMLRCKKALSTTPVVSESVDPVWINEDQELEWNGQDAASGSISGCHFQLDLIPPKTALKVDWNRVQGDFILGVYSIDAELDRAQSSAFLGQTIVSLSDMLPALLSKSPSLTQYLQLQSRTGKRIFSSSGQGAAEIVVAFLFVPSFESEVKHELAQGTRSSASARSTRSRLDDAKQSRHSSSSSKLHKEAKPTDSSWAYRQKIKAPSKTASSGINRKRFEQKISKENLEFAKRLEWKNFRRERLQDVTKAQEKNRITPPQHGAKKHGHKASSGINRTKFVELVSAENLALGKRLLAIAAPKKPLAAEQGFGGRVQDKALAEDRRRERQIELDFQMQKAQASYNKQSQLVADVTVLQDDVAQLKQQVDEVSRVCKHLEVLNRKDRHTRDCLRVAAEKEQSATSAGRGLKPSGRTQSHPRGAAKEEEDVDEKRYGMRQRECELLEKDRERLEAEKQRQSEDLLALKQEVKQLEDTAKKLESQVRTVRSQRMFTDTLKGGKISSIQAKDRAHAMERRLQAKELTKEEEEQWALYRAHEELAQLQLAIQVLERRATLPVEAANSTAGLKFSSTRKETSAASIYLASKIQRTTTKLKVQQEQLAITRKEYEQLVSSGAYEQLRAQVQELQHLVFLCRSQPKHETRAEKQAERLQQRMDAEFDRKLLAEQTETDLLLKKQIPSTM